MNAPGTSNSIRLLQNGQPEKFDPLSDKSPNSVLKILDFWWVLIVYFIIIHTGSEQPFREASPSLRNR